MIGKNMGFPYVIKADIHKGKNIKGELYAVDQNTLARMDQLEGVAHNHYRRITTSFKINNVVYVGYMYIKADGELPNWATGLDYIEEFVA
jgi:gamma-glutamylcyclotransferase (GGCT)/AIG2-like uncharacterized protein YtfP